MTVLDQTIAEILGFQSDVASNTAAAKGQTFSAQGYALEGEAYGLAADIATQNAALEAASGEIQAYQERRKVAEAIGGQRADTAAAGFKTSGSSLAALKSSYQQGYLSEQIIRTQSLMTEGGYLEEATAARLQRDAAGVAGKAATELGDAYTTAAGTAATQAAQETAALLGALPSPEQKAEVAAILNTGSPRTGTGGGRGGTAGRSGGGYVAPFPDPNRPLWPTTRTV